ncbi:protein Dr1 isoform X1 [Phodopus roborovskii]|uniref:protein Dr1 isoform X1 n=1 Tax=Phodopus roborovskii TaxID=109678 RepID=UPI0021E3987B|nr:protein Dr1 isoform X1 [Phodopus roborovskii]
MASSSGNDDDLTIPRAAINKMIKETLPNVRVANDARELVVNCCTEFIHLISSEANEICNKSEKKTISPEHVIQALESLGFGSYISEVKEVLQECKTVALKRRKASSRLENLGIPEEELLRQQQELFAKNQPEPVPFLGVGPHRLDNNKQNWPNRNGFKCSKLPNKPSLLQPQLVHPIRQDLLKMKKMMMISEIHHLGFCFLYKKTVKEMLI